MCCILKSYVMRCFICFVCCLFWFSGGGQVRLGNEVARKLPRSQLYIVGQGHNNQANTIIEQELLFSLNARNQVRYEILEYPHSVAFLLNRYLHTGDDSFLRLIHPEAGFTFIRSVKVFNDTIAPGRRIRFFGLDFENRQNGKFTRDAIKIILEERKPDPKDPLRTILQKIATGKPGETELHLIQLKNYLGNNESACRNVLGDYYTDVLLIAHAPFQFSSKRDAAMVVNFRRLYSELLKEDASPSFFASFGTGHINPQNKNGFAMQLLRGEQSPVKNNVCIIGIEYFNCSFGDDTNRKPTYGSLYFLCKPVALQKSGLMSTDTTRRITFVPAEMLRSFNCNNAVELLSGMIMVYHYIASEFGIWE